MPIPILAGYYGMPAQCEYMRNHTGTAVLNVTSKTAKFTIGQTTHDESLCLQALTVAPGQRCGATCYPNLVGETFDGSIEVWDMSTAQLNKAATDAAGGLPAADPLVSKALPSSSTRNTHQSFCLGIAPSTCRRRIFFGKTIHQRSARYYLRGGDFVKGLMGGWVGGYGLSPCTAIQIACRFTFTAYHTCHAPLACTAAIGDAEVARVSMILTGACI
jgi:hypothetical protein